MIRARCTSCDEPYRLRDELGGHAVRCRACGEGFRVPEKYSVRFAQFLERAPKPNASPKRDDRGRRRRRLLPVGPAALEREEPGREERLRSVAFAASGFALMAFTSALTFLIAHVALS